MIEPIEFSVMPRPTCVGPAPPTPSATGALAPASVCAIIVSKLTRWLL